MDINHMQVPLSKTQIIFTIAIYLAVHCFKNLGAEFGDKDMMES